VPATAALALLLAQAAGAVSIRWHPAHRIEPARNGGLSDVACPSATLCVAVDQSGWLVTTTRPTAGVWSRTVPIDSVAGGTLTGVSCPSTKLCVAVDAAGDVVTSTNPTGGAKAWRRPVRVDSTAAAGGGYAGLADISCPTVALCVAVDAGDPGNIVTSTNPTGGASAWRVTGIAGSVLTSVDCASATLCVAAGSQHYVATNPTGGAGAWRAGGAQAGGGIVSDIACPSATLCVGVGYGNTSPGLATASTTPKGATASWVTVGVVPSPPAPQDGLLDAVGCLTGSFCTAVDSADNAFSSATTGRGVWSASTAIAPVSGPTASGSAISCASTLCVVVDSNGYAVVGTRRG
jgi:hypothetical protein